MLEILEFIFTPIIWIFELILKVFDFLWYVLELFHINWSKKCKTIFCTVFRISKIFIFFILIIFTLILIYWQIFWL
jgi:hypothetical protein